MPSIWIKWRGQDSAELVARVVIGLTLKGGLHKKQVVRIVSACIDSCSVIPRISFFMKL
jgi:hypothetical protein